MGFFRRSRSDDDLRAVAATPEQVASKEIIIEFHRSRKDRTFIPLDHIVERFPGTTKKRLLRRFQNLGGMSCRAYGSTIRGQIQCQYLDQDTMVECRLEIVADPSATTIELRRL